MISVEEQKWYHLVSAVVIMIIILAHATLVLIVHITLMVQLLIQHAMVSQNFLFFTKTTCNVPDEFHFRETFPNPKQFQGNGFGLGKVE